MPPEEQETESLQAEQEAKRRTEAGAGKDRGAARVRPRMLETVEGGGNE